MTAGRRPRSRRPPGPDLVGTAVPVPIVVHSASEVAGIDEPDRRFLQLHFLTHDPVDGWDTVYGRFGAELDGSGVARHVWTGPFIPTVKGTDMYTDELW